jgi:hypothetical protein
MSSKSGSSASKGGKGGKGSGSTKKPSGTGASNGTGWNVNGDCGYCGVHLDPGEHPFCGFDYYYPQN